MVCGFPGLAGFFELRLKFAPKFDSPNLDFPNQEMASEHERSVNVPVA
jgi:hypothetical protein